MAEIIDLKEAKRLLENLYNSVYINQRMMDNLDGRLRTDLEYYFRKFEDEQ